MKLEALLWYGEKKYLRFLSRTSDLDFLRA